MRVFAVALILFVNMVLQSTLFNYIEIAGVKPNTALLIIVTYAMLRGDVEGAIVGFFAGLLQDIMFGRVVGLYALLGMVTGYFCGKPFKDFYRESIIIPIILVGASCVAYETAFYILSFMFRGRIDVVYYYGLIILPEAVYTVALTIPVYKFMYGVNARLEAHERYTRKLF